MSSNRKSVGREIADRLSALNAAIDNGESIGDRFTCNRVILDLNPRDYTPQMVQKARRSLRVSQALFAQFLGVSPSAVKSWEQGSNPVPGMACRFMDEFARNPEYWKKRLRESMVDKELV